MAQFLIDFPLRLVSSPIENLVVGEDADHRRQESYGAKYLSKRYYLYPEMALIKWLNSLLIYSS